MPFDYSDPRRRPMFGPGAGFSGASQLGSMNFTPQALESTAAPTGQQLQHPQTDPSKGPYGDPLTPKQITANQANPPPGKDVWGGTALYGDPGWYTGMSPEQQQYYSYFWQHPNQWTNNFDRPRQPYTPPAQPYQGPIFGYGGGIPAPRRT